MGVIRFLYQWGGGLVMAIAFLIGIPGSFSATRELVSWVSSYGVQPIHLAFWLLGTGAIYTTIIQGIRIKRLESPKTAIDVKFKTQVGREITLIVRNKGNIPATFSADMTCSIIPGEHQLTKILQLIDASMVWESSGTDTETINAGRSKVLKVCYFKSEDRNGLKICNMNFYKRELSKSEIVPCADCTESDTPAPKVQMNITFGSNLPIHGKSDWKYEITYALPAPLLHIKNL